MRKIGAVGALLLIALYLSIGMTGIEKADFQPPYPVGAPVNQ